ncbi:MAG: GNAT family N-acetyltransferase [Cyanobacteria bacterium J06626_18]
MTFEIREIQPQDNAQLAAIIRQILTEFGANRPGFAWSDPELDTLSAAYASKEAIYYVVTVSSTIVGGAGIAPFPCQTPNLCELQKMYLVPESRGMGIGQALMDKLLQTAETLGYQGCYLETFHTMSGAIRLYEKSGFEPLPKPLGNSGHTSCNQFYLRWFDSIDIDDFA